MKRHFASALISSVILLTSQSAVSIVSADTTTTSTLETTSTNSPSTPKTVILNGATLETPIGIQVGDIDYLPLTTLIHVLHNMGIDSTQTNGLLFLNVPKFYSFDSSSQMTSSTSAVLMNNIPVEPLDITSYTDPNNNVVTYVSVKTITNVLERLKSQVEWDGSSLTISNSTPLPTYVPEKFSFGKSSVKSSSIRLNASEYMPLPDLQSLLGLLNLQATDSQGGNGINITAPSSAMSDLGTPSGSSGSYTLSVNSTVVERFDLVHYLDSEGNLFVDYVPLQNVFDLLKRLHYTATNNSDVWSIAVSNPTPPKPPTVQTKNIVNPFHTYSYNQMAIDIAQLAKTYPELVHYEVLGKTAYGRNMYAVSVGTGKATAFINGSHHAREWLTTNLNMYMIDQYAQAYAKNQSMDGYNVRQLLNQTTLWFIPMVNPDGVTLVQQGAGAFPASVRKNLVRMNHGSYNFSDWKANALGVDLNRQYPAGWSTISVDPVRYPNFQDYKGTAPLQMNETEAVMKLINQTNPQMEISYHTAGDFIYWGWYLSGSFASQNYTYSQTLAHMLRYTVNWTTRESGGGLTDWWTHYLKRPGFTIEITPYSSAAPVPISSFASAWRENKDIGLYLAQESYKLYLKHPTARIKI